jgi:hypothetical protein
MGTTASFATGYVYCSGGIAAYLHIDALVQVVGGWDLPVSRKQRKL